MNRLFEMLHNPEQCTYGDETLIYFNGDKMIILAHEGEDEDLVQIEGKVDVRLPAFISSILNQ